MIPLRDTIPINRIPFVNYGIMALSVAMFVVQLLQPDGGESITYQFGVVPIRTATGFLGQGGLLDAFLPLVTYQFLHGGFLHIGSNMLYLWIFGDNVEDHLGHVRYLLFYLLAGIGAALIQMLFALGSNVPIIGASGAIAGVMGAYFVLYPHARVLTLVPILIFIQVMEVPATLFLGFWILLQFISAGGGGSGVAWWAHIGGFFVGMALLALNRSLNRRKRRKNRNNIRPIDLN